MLKTLKNLLDDLAHLRLPTTAAAIVGLVVQLLPGVHIDGTVVAGVLVGVGGVAYAIEDLLNKDSK